MSEEIAEVIATSRELNDLIDMLYMEGGEQIVDIRQRQSGARVVMMTEKFWEDNLDGG